MFYTTPSQFEFLKQKVLQNWQNIHVEHDIGPAFFSRTNPLRDLGVVIDEHFKHHKSELLIITDCMSLPSDVRRNVHFYYRLDDQEMVKPIPEIESTVGVQIRGRLKYLDLRGLLVPGYGPAGQLKVTLIN